ncbi:MAG: hypothetical protein JNM27_13650 [Leptospirales bacterium]|nr:hypothetical protein [Leptospirales bacterium]
MGSVVTLRIDKFDLDWGKNESFIDHSVLYSETDVKKEYYYYAENQRIKKNALSRRLIELKDTLELLGYSLKNIRRRFQELCANHKRYSGTPVPLDYRTFHDGLIQLRPELVESHADEEFPDDHGFYKYFKYSLKEKLRLTSENYHNLHDEFFDSIHPYIVLRILIENPANHERSVIWGYQDILNGGWISKKGLFQSTASLANFLIVTEGSSDTHVIRKSLEILNPGISKFFRFVDMQENYPFTGTGNLYNFVKGLSRIGMVMNVLVVFDNDAEGSDKFDKCQTELQLPANIRVSKLPNLKSLRKFRTIGPSGSKISNINGTAASIECFLDLTYQNTTPASVRWKTYNERSNAYQGALQNKEKFVSLFLKMRSPYADYDFEKLRLLNQHIIRECIAINETPL